MVPTGTPHRWHVDARRFGQELRSRREAAGLSSRRLAELADVSQAYVIALERSVSSRDPVGPSPTIKTLVGLASALDVHPADLLDASLVSVGPHVLYVVEGDGQEIFETTARLIADVEVWVSAGARHDDSSDAAHHVALHPHGDRSFRQDPVSRSLHDDLAKLQPVLQDKHVGIVASDDPDVLIGTETDVLAIEHQWPSLVGAAAWAAGARTVTTVCVWELDVVQQLTSPYAAALELLDSHDTVWCSTGERTWRGLSASLRVLQHLRPPRLGADAWRASCLRDLDRLESARRPILHRSRPGPHRH